MNATEQLVADQYQDMGYTVLYRGCPDFLICKDGKIAFVEVKFTGRVSPHQQEYHKVLRRAGLSVKVVRVNRWGSPPPPAPRISRARRTALLAAPPLPTSRELLLRDIDLFLQKDLEPDNRAKALKLKAELLGGKETA
jgi:hypothetical protein